jgi:hypothetical protein
VDLGLEIMVRVPNFNFALKGEVLIHFKELKANWRMNKTKMVTSLNVNVKTKKMCIPRL